MSARIFVTAALVLIVVASVGCVGASPAQESMAQGKAELEKGDFDLAIAAYTKAIELEPKDAQAYSNRG